ncbi:hypothetical protein SLS62_008714 [Diatrype stigma]|uniref:Uncharacterized protein n=1 Tax=Diatrype stigma TaxID=117547 RepID=A0AAN9UI74_9PEZI
MMTKQQVTDTMLHELAHNVHGPHDAKFHALWNQLREEHEALVMKGYTGEGFLSAGHRLGGRRVPKDEARRMARAAAEKRRTLAAGSGQRLGGAPIRPGQDIRRVIANAAERRNRTLRGCANDNQTQEVIREIADTATRNGFRTQAEEDAANEAAIAQALWELVQEDEKAKYGEAYVPPTASNPAGNRGGSDIAHERPRANQVPPSPPPGTIRGETEKESQARPAVWTCEICTLENPFSYLCCDACGTERGDNATRDLAEKSSKNPRTVIDLTESDDENTRTVSSSSVELPRRTSSSASHAADPVPQTWQCSFCGRIRERKWWTCDLCGTSELFPPVFSITSVRAIRSRP